MRDGIFFVAKVTVAHLVSYFVVGSLAYEFLTKPLYEGPSALFNTFMRTPADPEDLSHIALWFLPAQLARGLLYGVALLPFREFFLARSRVRGFVVLVGLSVVFTFWSSATAAPGTIEGLVYLRPEFDWRVHLRVQPELLLQLTWFSAWVAWWVGPPPPSRAA
jgi:hypothetical protein